MITFNSKLPEWKNEGSEPSTDRKTEGFIAGYKPPAAFFNWLFNKAYLCIKEIREKLSDLEGKNISSFDVSETTVEFKNSDGQTLGSFFTHDTTYSASSPLTQNGTTFGHANSGATAGSYGNSANQTPAYGATFNVPYVTVNATGHVTAISNKTVKIPASDNTWRGIQNNLTSTSTTDSLSAAQGKALKDLIDVVGGTVKDSGFKSVTTTANTATNINNVTLTAGSWIIIAQADAGAYEMEEVTIKGNSEGVKARGTRYAVVTDFGAYTSSTTVYLRVKTTTARSVNGRILAIRIK